MVMAIPAPGSSSNTVKVIVSTDISDLKPGMAEARREIEQTGRATEVAAARMGGMGQAADAMRDEVAQAAGAFSGLVDVALRFVPAVGVAGVGALAAFALAAKEGADESARLNKELVMSGNAAGSSVGQLQARAAAVAEAAKATRGDVAGAMAEMLAAGNVAAASIDKAAQAAVMLERTGGQAVKQTAAEFSRLGDEPVKASIALNEKYHYLTAAVFEQIKALEDQGRATEAAQLAQETYADAVVGRMRTLQDQGGNLEKVWHSIRGAARSAWDAMMDIGRSDDGNWEKKLADAKARAANGGGLFGNQANADLEVAVLQAKVEAEQAAAKAAGDRARQEQAGIAWQQEGDRYLTRREQKEREIAKARQLALQAGVSEVELAGRLAAIEDKYAEKGATKRRGTTPKAEASDEALAYARAMDALADSTSKADAAQLGLSSSQRQIYDLMTSPQWATMPDTWRQTAAAQFEQAYAAEQAAASQKRLNDMLAATDSARIEKARDDMLLLAAALEQGVISEQRYLEAVDARLNKGNQEIEKKGDLAKSLGLTFTSAFESAVAGGRKFSDVLKGLEQDILRLLTRMAVTEPLGKAAQGFDWGSLVKGVSSWFTGAAAPNAAGGVYASPSLSAYSNGVYGPGQQKFFKFASGAAIGTFAEPGAGYEAIMPLKRGKDGKLGVSMDGGGANVTVNVINNTDGTARQERRSDGRGGTIIDVIVERAKNAVAADIGSGNGPVPAALQGAYGLNRAAGAY